MENSPKDHNDEIDLLEILGVIWLYKYVILAVALFGLIASLGYVFLKSIEKPQVYHRSQLSVYFPVIEESHSAGLAQLLLSSHANFKMMQSKSNVKEKLSYNQFGQRINISFDDDSRILKAFYIDEDKENSLNILEHLWNYTSNNLEAMEGPKSFKLVDPPFYLRGEVNFEQRKKVLIPALGLILSLVLGVFIAFIFNFVQRIKSDPKSIKKIKGEF